MKRAEIRAETEKHLTQEFLRQRLAYDPATGAFTWLPIASPVGSERQWNGRYAGKPAGYVHQNGYVYIQVAGKLRFAHRLAWLYVHGSLPALDVDHRDGNRSNNAISNLREATGQQNQRNAKSKRDRGTKGVYFQASRGKWMAQIRVDGRRLFLGRFDDERTAHAAYINAANQHHGEFARFQ